VDTDRKNLDTLINKVICGDSREILKQIPDESVDLILTDLPYGLTQNEWDERIDLENLWIEWNRIRKEKTAIILTAKQPFTTELINANPKMFKYEWIWLKTHGNNFLNANKQPLQNHENVLVFYEKQPTYNPQMTDAIEKNIRNPQNRSTGTYCQTYGVVRKDNMMGDYTKRFPTTVQYFREKRGMDRFHPSEKPIELFSYLIKTYTNTNDLVLDCCIGSGTTAISCINTERNFIGIEISPKYCEIARKRIEKARQSKSYKLTEYQ